MSRLFYNYKGRNCDILHSTYFNGLTFRQRQKLAFDKKELAKLSETDKLLLRGYAQNIVERQNAWKYKHKKTKNTKRTTNNSRPKNANSTKRK